MKIFENVLLLAAVQFVSMALPLLWLPYLAITLGGEQLGRVAFALSICQIIVTVTDYGFNLSGPKAIAIHRENPEKIAEIYGAITFLRLILAVAGLLFLLIAAWLFESIGVNLPLILVAYVMVIGNVIYPQWFFQGLEQLRAISIIQVLARTIILCGIFVAVKGPDDIYWAAFFQSGGILLGGLIAVPHTLKALKDSSFIRPKLVTIRSQLKDGWHFFLSSAAVNIYTTSNTIILGLIAEPLIVGYYFVAEKMIRAVLMIFSPITSAIYPHVSRLASADDPELFRKFISKVIALFICLGIFLSAGVFLFAPLLISSLFGTGYTASIAVLQVFALLPLPLSVSSVLGTLIMLPYGQQKDVSRVLLAAAVVDLAIFIPATYFFGAIGAAGANVAVESFVTLALITVWYYAARDRLRVAYPR